MESIRQRNIQPETHQDDELRGGSRTPPRRFDAKIPIGLIDFPMPLKTHNDTCQLDEGFGGDASAASKSIGER